MVEIRAPFQVTVNITHRCNLACAYCYASDRNPIDMPTERCIDLIDTLCRDHGVFHLTVAGGETLLHPGILTVLQQCFPRHKGVVALLSNGLRLNEDPFFQEFSEVCQALADQGAPLDLQISLDSHLPEINDRQRDRGADILHAIERALSLPLSLQLACVVTRHNVDVAHGMIEAYYPRVRRFHYMNLMPSRGRSRGSAFQDLRPDDTQKQAFHQRVLAIEKRCPDTYITKVIEPCIKDGGGLQVPGCLGGTTRIDIEPDFTVMACPMSGEVLGSLADQTFEEMWFSAQAERIRAKDRPYCMDYLSSST